MKCNNYASGKEGLEFCFFGKTPGRFCRADAPF